VNAIVCVIRRCIACTHACICEFVCPHVFKKRVHAYLCTRTHTHTWVCELPFWLARQEQAASPAHHLLLFFLEVDHNIKPNISGSYDVVN